MKKLSLCYPPREVCSALSISWRRLYALTLLLMGVALTHAQSTPATGLRVTGTVYDAEGLTLPGVSVMEKGASTGTQTDLDGAFSVTVSNANATLVFSFLGLQTREQPLNGATTVNITLQAAQTALDEVVVVGYTTQRRSKVIGAVDQVSDGAFKGRAVVNTTQALQGKSPGLIIQQTNSEPGAALNFNIRGISTLGNNTPLVVIDGIVGGDINALNPADIESVSVLKDAGSAAIYGSRASNGVVLITTKQGRKNSAMTVNYSTLIGYNNPTFFTKPVHGYENAMLRNEAAFNSNVSQMPFTSAQIQQLKANGDTEWFAEEITKPALQQSHTFSVSGGNENSTYMVSLGYLNQESNLVGPDKGMERYNYRINLTNEYGRFKLTSNLAYAKQLITDHSSSTSMLMVDAFRTPLYYRQKDAQGNYLTNDVLQEFNPLGILEKGGFRKYDNDDVFGTLAGELKIADGFKVKGVFGGRLWSNTMFSRTKEVHFSPGGVYGADRNTNDTSRKSLDLNTQFMAEYNKTFADRHTIGALLGYSNENHQDRGIGLFRIKTDPDLGTPGTDPDDISDDSYNSNKSTSRNSLNSVFGQLTYDYDNKYFGEFRFRYDGSSKFRSDKRWGFFPSLTLGYNLTREGFMQNYRDKVGNIKVRTSYGIVGNQNVNDFQYQDIYKVYQGGYAYGNSAVNGVTFNFGNENIQWEKAATFNAGVDVDFFNGDLSFSFDFFDKVTRDILLKPIVPGTFGSTLPDYNSGKVNNRGWELTANYRHNGKLFRHNFTFNIADTKNKVLDYGGKEQLTTLEELQVIIREGLPINSYVGYIRDGIFKSYDEIEGAAVPEGLTVVPGDNRYVDLNKDGVINDKDKAVLGNSFPRFTFGFTYNVEYKNFDLSLFVQGVGQRTMMIRGELVEPFHYNYGMTMYTHQLDYWTPANPDAHYPRLSNNGTMSNTNNFRRGSDMYLFDGAYARLKNIQIGYSLPETTVKSLGVSKIRAYASGQNLLTLSKVGFVDPELSEFNNNMAAGNGANSGRAYPTLVYYGLGLDVTF